MKQNASRLRLIKPKANVENSELLQQKASLYSEPDPDSVSSVCLVLCVLHIKRSPL